MPTTLVVKIACRDAERARRELADAGVLRKDAVPQRTPEFVFFPITKKIPLRVAHSFSRKRLASRVSAQPFKRAISGFLSKRELGAAVTSFDLIGGIAVIQVPARLEKKKKKIARALLGANNRIETVLRKTGGRRGEYRVQRVEWLAGAKTFAATHKENGCFFRVDLRRAYYSPRLSTERQRIASLVKKNERVLVPFAGVGPFAIPIAKQSKAVEVIAIELNPAAVKLLRENVALNRVSERVRVIEGDALKIMSSKEFRSWADRIVMPLPHSARSFLPAALKALKRGGVIHFYRIVEKRSGAHGGERELER
ncbi:MAG: class I SAM-dependent methyltransferase family protein, partial [Candidatus Micrarchaeota archaeon]